MGRPGRLLGAVQAGGRQESGGKVLFRLLTSFWSLAFGLITGVYQFARCLFGQPADPTSLVIAAGLFVLGLAMAASIWSILEDRIDID